MASIQACLAGSRLARDQVILYFPQGLPGFERHRFFTAIERADLAPLVCLQSTDSADLSLWLAPVAAIDADYCLEVSGEDLRILGLDEARQPKSGQEVLCLALLCAPENGQLTANLLAPVVVNLRTRVAVQAVRTDSRYSHRHPILAETPCS
jgi:flagellar assembly factor FliW